MADTFDTKPDNFSASGSSVTKYLDLAGLQEFWSRSKDYIDNQDSKLHNQLKAIHDKIKDISGLDIEDLLVIGKGDADNSAVLKNSDSIASGKYAVSIGYNTEAKGHVSHAEGGTTKALSEVAHTEGLETISGRISHIIDPSTGNIRELTNEEILILVNEALRIGLITTQSEFNNTAAMKLIGFASHAEGSETKALGTSSHAEGYLTEAASNSSHAEGDSTHAWGEASHAEGYLTEANGNQSHSEGKQTKAQGNSSHAEGYGSNANGDYSHAEGIETQSNGWSSHTEGGYNITVGAYSHIEGRGNYVGDNDNYPVEVVDIDTKAYCAHSEGQGTKATGNSAHAEGCGTAARGISSHAEGYGSNANGDYSHTEGQNTNAAGTHSHAEGYRSNARGSYSHAEGYSSYTEGPHSHAEGYRTQAIGESSHAEGYGSVARGSYSHAGGYYTITSNDAEFATGKYNVSNSDTLFSVGNGTSKSDRKNAFEVKTDNTAYVNGKQIATLEDIPAPITVDTELDPMSDNPIANSAVANAIKGGAHFIGTTSQLPWEGLQDTTIGQSLSGEGDATQEYSVGDIIIVASGGNEDGFNEPTKEYILSYGNVHDHDAGIINGYRWVELGDITPAQDMINESLKNYYKKSETYKRTEVDSKFEEYVPQDTYTESYNEERIKHVIISNQDLYGAGYDSDLYRWGDVSIEPHKITLGAYEDYMDDENGIDSIRSNELELSAERGLRLNDNEVLTVDANNNLSKSELKIGQVEISNSDQQPNYTFNGRVVLDDMEFETFSVVAEWDGNDPERMHHPYSNELFDICKFIITSINWEGNAYGTEEHRHSIEDILMVDHGKLFISVECLNDPTIEINSYNSWIDADIYDPSTGTIDGTITVTMPYSLKKLSKLTVNGNKVLTEVDITSISESKIKSLFS